MDRLVALPISSEPEKEVPSVNEEYKERSDKELLDGTQGVVATPRIELHEVEQPRELKMSFDEAGDDSPIAVEDSKLDFDDLGSQFTWSDDDHSELEGFGLNIYDSIRAIRKEASKIDAVMAIDQLDLLREEIRSMRRELNDHNAEVEELQALAQLKDDRIGTLELERDLYKADTNKLSFDLENCLLKLRRLGTESDPVDDHQIQDLLSGEPGKAPNDPTSSRGVGEAKLSVQNEGIASRQYRTDKRLDPPSCADLPRTTTSHTTVTASTTSRSITSHALIPVFEKPRISTGSMRANMVASRARRPKARTFAFCLSSSQKQGKVSETSPREMEPPGVLQEQIQEMSQRLKSALATSEELRRRLAMLNRYYESLVRQLQDSLVELKTDRAQMEFDLTRKISTMDRENRSTLAEIESKTREQEVELQILRGQRVITFDS
jgi:uncharacterized coiled-coil DUF342 family protein